MAKKKIATKTRPRRKLEDPVADAAEALVAPAGGVVVRMYRQGLGDCFLLAFGGATKSVDDTRYVLIDCGVHARQTNGPQRLMKVMANIAAATGGRLDVVVATHEHADHLSGFVQKDSPFLSQTFKEIKQLWVGWTEKVGDRLADTLRRRRGTARSIIQKAVDKARQATKLAGPRQRVGLQALQRELEVNNDFESQPEFTDAEAAARLIGVSADQDKTDSRGLRRFLPGNGSHEVVGPGLGAAGKKAEKPTSNELALGVLQATAQHVEYCMPGDMLEIPDIPGVRVHVLGPPHDEVKLKKDLPTKVRGAQEGEDHYKEVYLATTGASLSFGLSPALGEIVDPLKYPEDLRNPFDSTQRRTFDVASRTDEQFRNLPTATQELLNDTYFQARGDWRRIDGDWLAAAGELALNLDSDTNNTSLVLAFEWNSKVLLFVGDAQVGNWLSWRDQKYKDSRGKPTVTVDDLLERTVLYKVGHHGSHNATLKRDPDTASDQAPFGGPYGLELMRDIVAMIPVDRAAAEKDMPNPWEMPHRPLYERLREKARRRVLRADAIVNVRPLEPSVPPDVTPQSSAPERVPDLQEALWRRSAERFPDTQDPLFYEITFT